MSCVQDVLTTEPYNAYIGARIFRYLIIESKVYSKHITIMKYGWVLHWCSIHYLIHSHLHNRELHRSKHTEILGYAYILLKINKLWK